MRNKLNVLFLIATVSLLASCGNETIIDEQKDMENGQWHVDSLATFSFNIEDTTIQYTLDYNVRYAVDYPYYNLYIKYYLEDSTGQLVSSELQELLLFDRKTGKPLGDGLGDIFDRAIPIFEDQKFAFQGDYSFKVKQFMRMDYLPGIQSFGLKIEIPEAE